jgi:hypothetical protein
MGLDKFHRVAKIDLDTFHRIVGPQCDAIIMDPPFGHGGWTHTRWTNFVSSLYRSLRRCFIVTWVDPGDLTAVVDAIKHGGYVFCDSMAVELLDPFGRAYFVKSDPSKFPRNCRMAIMFRTDDINRSDLRQQRVKDTGFGIVAEGGKTYGRLSMPMTLHTIVETMLPDRKVGPRVFVELWPNLFTRRPKWIQIDEMPDEGAA